MIESKGWNWKIIKDEKEKKWKNPSIESYHYHILIQKY